MRQILSPDDLKRGELAEPGWHPAEIVDYKEEAANTDKSTNCLFFFKILEGPSKGIQPRSLFNEKALGFGKNLWPIIGVPRTPDGGFACSTEVFQASIGKKLRIYTKVGESNKGNKFTDIVDYMPLAS